MVGSFLPMIGFTCNLCQSLGRRIRIEGHVSGKRYEKLFADGDLTERPTLVYCPHSGKLQT